MILIPLASSPKKIALRKKDLQEHQHNKVGAHAHEVVPKAGEQQVYRETDQCRGRRQALRGGRVAVPPVWKPEHRVVEDPGIEVQRSKYADERRPRRENAVDPVLLGREQPHQKRHREKFYPALDRLADCEPKGGFGLEGEGRIFIYQFSEHYFHCPPAGKGCQSQPSQKLRACHHGWRYIPLYRANQYNSLQI